MHGVVNINKPSGMTSHDVVLQVRRILREKRIGHTGTLDPLATGVLVLCVGRATRIAQYLEAGEKEYRAVMRLGITTDTLDSDGRIVETKPYTAPGRDNLLSAIQQFTGQIMQSPPAFSAVKVRGVPSYKLAREGRPEFNQARSVTIHSIELMSYEDPFVALRVCCLKGVYIRSLCAGIGDALGMGAHVTSLERTSSGRFRIGDALSLEELGRMAAADKAHQVVLPIDDALGEFPIIELADEQAVKVVHGNKVSCRESQETSLSGLARLRDTRGRLLALARIEGGVIQPALVFS